MRSLQQSLQDQDAGHLHIVARLWGLEPPDGEGPISAKWLVERMTDAEQLHALWRDLPKSARAALEQLAAEGGRLPWIDFVQRHGELREMGPGRRDREQPWRDPASPVEVLWYRGLIARAFGDSPVGPKEFAFIPNELQPILPSGPPASASELGRPTAEPEQVEQAGLQLVDDVTTLLAALRRRPEPGSDLSDSRRRALRPFLTQPPALPLVLALLLDGSLLTDSPLRPMPQRVGTFLDRPRPHALASLMATYRSSSRWNDFELLQHLEPGPGGWPNDPQASRAAVLDFLRRVPRDRWWDLDSFLGAVRARYPSFQRPGGDFDSWYLRDRRTGTYLRGMASWDSVDGALLRAVITGPLHWLGAIDLGREADGEHAASFRLNSSAAVLLDEAEPGPVSVADAPTRLLPDGTIEIPRGSSPRVRYQVARLCTWLSYDDGTYRYRLRPSAVLAGEQQGLQLSHVHRLLEELTPETIPAGLGRALDRLAENRIEARAERALVLRVEQAELLDRMLAEPKVNRWLGERLGPTAATVKPEHLDALVRTAAALGLLVEPPSPESGDEP